EFFVAAHSRSISMRNDHVSRSRMPGGRAPVSEQHSFHIRERQPPLQQRIVVKINLADRQVIGRSPIGINLVKQFRRECVGFHGPVYRIELRLRTWAVDRASMSSSSVRMTRTLTRPESGEISGAFFALHIWLSS